jgi:hypothetical protein
LPFHGYCGTGNGLAISLSSFVGIEFEKDVVVVFPQVKHIIENDKWAKPGSTT